MTSLIIIWKTDDMSDIKVATDDQGHPLLFEYNSGAKKYAAGHYGLKVTGHDRHMYPITDSTNVCNYKVVEL
jgi:hypothetical protein